VSFYASDNADMKQTDFLDSIADFTHALTSYQEATSNNGVSATSVNAEGHSSFTRPILVLTLSLTLC
jgi:hypothetical protein